MPIYRLGDLEPRIDATAFVHPDAIVIGDVTLAAHVSVWPGAVLRGDFGPIVVGRHSLVEDGCVLHGTKDRTVVGDGVVLGHISHAQGCTIDDEVLVGSGAVVLDGARVGRGTLVAAGAVVTPGVVVPPHSRVVGVPGRIEHDRGIGAKRHRDGLEEYAILARRYAADLVRVD